MFTKNPLLDKSKYLEKIEIKVIGTSNTKDIFCLILVFKVFGLTFRVVYENSGEIWKTDSRRVAVKEAQFLWKANYQPTWSASTSIDATNYYIEDLI